MEKIFNLLAGETGLLKIGLDSIFNFFAVLKTDVGCGHGLGFPKFCVEEFATPCFLSSLTSIIRTSLFEAQVVWLAIGLGSVGVVGLLILSSVGEGCLDSVIEESFFFRCCTGNKC